MERAMAETGRRREKQVQWNEENGITPESVKSRISDILDSVYEKDHVRADISGFADSGAMMGNNLKTHLEHLERKMRDAAADLDFETAARLRDEIKRLRETELAIADDPLAREVEGQSPFSGREKGKHNKGRQRHRTVEEDGRSPSGRPISPLAGEMSGRTEGGAKGRNPSKTSLFAKPSLDDMGPGTDMAKPAGAIPRSLFKKQTHEEAHGSDYGLPDDGSGRSPSGRPAAAPFGARPRSEPRGGDSVSERNRSLFRKNTLDEMTVRRTEKPADSPKPVKREQVGLGSYEDASDQRRQGRRSKKSGRPGH
jgi:excinuclease ABC subunit B